MQFGARVLALAFACGALSLAADAQTTFTFRLNQAQSNFTFSGTTTAGPIVGNPSNMFQLLGTQNVDLTLQSGAQPFSTLAFSGGSVATSGPLHGKINNPISPFLPPLVTIDVNNLVLSASSPSATVGANGAFTANATLTALSGQLVVSPITGSPSTSDLTGSMSNPTAVMGTITMSGGAFHLSGPVNTTFMFSDPGSGQSGTITLVGTIVADWSLVQSYCAGDGSGTACPCGNNSPAGQNRGCLNSTGVGAQLTATGLASLGSDTLVLHGAGLPAASTGLFFQGSAQSAGGAGAVFGDGLRCAGGTVVRLGTEAIASGASAYPGAGDPSVSTKGMVMSSASTRGYQLWYRNSAAFCTPSTFNLTNGLWVTWLP
jgi:hypothetical protein